MNLLILSPGRRVDIVEYFKTEFHANGGLVYTADMSSFAPALYSGDVYFVVKKDFNDLESYVLKVLSLCKENGIGAILTLIDPELELLAKYRDLFLKNDITPIVSPLEEIRFTFDKYLFYKTLSDVLPVLPTYDSVYNVKKALEDGAVAFPLFAKPRYGSGSTGIAKVENEKHLDTYSNTPNFIFQPFIKSKEYGVDVYFDMCSHKIISHFIKEKIAMRSGETDKAISVQVPKIFELIEGLGQYNFLGPIDVDIFEDDNHVFFINEINPRFGGGYPHAYHCGINFMKYLVNNLDGHANEVDFKGYKAGVAMMKYNGLFFCDKDDFAK